MIKIEFIPHAEQRYDTVGDWQWQPTKDNPVPGDLHIRVSRMSDWRSEYLVAIHELAEACLCNWAGISEQVVDDWDVSHLDSEEPGALEGCPYRTQHWVAEMVEYLCAFWMGLPGHEHQANIEEVEHGSILRR